MKKLATVLALSFLCASYVAAAPRVIVELDAPLMDVGGVVLVDVVATGVTNLFGASLRLDFDADRLEFVAATAGSLFAFGARFPPLVSVQDTAGRLAIATSRNVGDTEVSLDGTLVRLEFRAIATGFALLEVPANTIVMVTKLGTPIPEVSAVSTVSARVVIGDGLVLNPPAGPVGSATFASGSGFFPRESVRVTFDGTDLVGSFSADSGGTARGLPIDVPLITGGPHQVLVEGLESGRQFSVTFDVTPHVLVLSPVIEGLDGAFHVLQPDATPVFVGPGDLVLVTANGFGADDPLRFDVGAAAVQSVLSGDRSNALGEVQAQIVMPSDMAQGPTSFAIEGVSSRLRVALPGQLEIVPRILSVQPPFGGIDALIQITASGFPPNETVEVLFDGQVVADATGTTVDTRGSVRTTIAITRDRVLRSEDRSVPIALRTSGHASASAPFVYTPTPMIVELIPEGGDTDVTVGEVIDATGVGFPFGQPLTGTFGGQAITLSGAPADEQGNVSLRFTVPRRPAGVQELVLAAGSRSTSFGGLRVTGRISNVRMEGGSTQSVGAFGTLLVIEGDGFEPGETIAFDLGSIPDVHSTIAMADGTFLAGIVLPQLPIDVPTGTGEVILAVRSRSGRLDTSVFISSPSLDVLSTARIVVSPASAKLGEAIRITCTGYAANFVIGTLQIDSQTDLRVSPKLLPVSQILAGSITASGLVTDANGVLAVLTTLPALVEDSKAGAKEVMGSLPIGIDAKPAIAAPFEIESHILVTNSLGIPVTELSPLQVVFVDGSGFGGFEVLQTSIGSSSISFLQQTNASGQFSDLQYTIPTTSGGPQSLKVQGLQSTVVAELDVTIHASLTLVSPTPETVVFTGSLVSVHGVGFPDGAVVFDVSDVTLTPTIGSSQSIGGSFVTSFTSFTGALPARAPIRATVEDVSEVTAGQLRFGSSSLGISPTSGPVGTLIRITGALSNIITFGDRPPVPMSSAALIQGFWEGQFSVPAIEGGVYDIVLGTLPQGATAPTFTVTPTLNASPVRLRIGDQLSVQGTGFTGGITTMTIGVGNTRTPVVVATDSTGQFSTTLPVPATVGGRTRVSATDQSAVLSVPIEIDPILVDVQVDADVVVDGAVPIGSDLSVRGFGFGPGEEVSVFVGSEPALPTRAPTTNEFGTIEATVPVPAVPAGIHAVRVLGNRSGLSASLPAAVSVLPRLDSPVPGTGSVGAVIAVSGGGFGIQEIVRVEIGGILLGETTTETDGSFALSATMMQALEEGLHDLVARGLDTGVTGVLFESFQYRDTTPPVIEQVTVTPSRDPLITGDTITIRVVEAEDFETITQATYVLGSLSGPLVDEDGDRIWTALITVEGGLRIVDAQTTVELFDLAGNRAQARSDERITIDTIVDFGGLTVTGSPARAGDVILVIADAEEGGLATFTIPGVVDDVPMPETDPGTYEGDFLVEPGDAANEVAVTLRFTDGVGNTILVDSETLVTIDAVAEIHGVEVIGSPARQGDTLTFVVTAESGGVVRVTVEGLVVDLALVEDPAEPGVYTGLHVVERIDPLADAVVSVSFTDEFGHTAQDDSARATILELPHIGLSLVRGINFISLAVNDPSISTMSDLLEVLGAEASFVVWQRPDNGQFIVYSRDLSPSSAANGPVLGGVGYLVVALAPVSATLFGPPWPQDSVELRAGVNLIGLTRDDPGLRRLSDFESRIGAAFQQAIALDAEAQRFVSFLPFFDPESPINRPVSIGNGYIIVTNFPRTLTFEGPAPTSP